MNKVTNFILIALIAILFTSLVFYAANLFFNQDRNSCWESYPEKMDLNGNYVQPEEANICNMAYLNSQDKLNEYRLILIGIVALIVIGTMIFLSFGIFQQGLFYGSILSSIIANIAYFNSKSIIGFILAVLILAEIGLLISKKYKNN